MASKLLTTKEACEALRISRKTLLKMEKEGKIGYTRVSERKKLYLEDEVNELVLSNYKK